MKASKTDFGIHPAAMAILYLLSVTEVEVPKRESGGDAVTVSVYPWYNGREQGICLVYSYMHGWTEMKSAFVTFGEDRKSDYLFVDTWMGKAPFNQPTVADFPETAYDARKYFQFDQHYKAAEFIAQIAVGYTIKVEEALKNKALIEQSTDPEEGSTSRED